jgi:hypothetical protein
MLADTRNHLIHGGSLESLQAKIGMTLPQAINNAAEAAWHAIWRSMPPLDPQAHFGHHDGDFVRRDLLVSMDMTFEHSGDGPHPVEDQIPEVQISLQTSFGPNDARPNQK